MSTNNEALSNDQKEYLEGFFSGVRIRGEAFDGAEDTAPPPKLCKEEKLKAKGHPFLAYSEIRRKSREALPPEGEDLFRFKWNGLFWLAPVKDGYMCRLRIPGGIISAAQMRELGKISTDIASGFLQVTTRNNFQIRVIAPENTEELLRRIIDCGLHSKGSGADNIRNLTMSPCAGLDPYELVDVKPLIEDLQAVIMNDIEFYDLPRKFNISLNGGGLIGVAEDTNDIGLRAFAHPGDDSITEGVYFNVLLGGVTGHEEFAEHSGVICSTDQAVDVCAAMTKVFARNGNRGNRGKSRLVYLLKDWGFEKLALFQVCRRDSCLSLSQR